MGLTLQVPPGFFDLANAALQAGDPAFAINLAKIYSNAAFGMVRTEIFHDLCAHGETVPLHSSPTDGYNYSRDELTYLWHVHSSGEPTSNWISGADSLWYCNWKVDQTTGAVSSHEWYRRSGAHYDGVHTNDGTLRVITIAQREQTSLIMAAAAAYSAISGGSIATDKPLTQALAQALNDDAKFGIVNSEVIYLGEFYHGQTVPAPASPADGYTYTRTTECKFMFSWRWTPGTTTFAAPPLSYGQLGPFQGAVSSAGVVSTTIYYDDNNGNLISVNEGRIAVFAFCSRSATPGSISPAAANFTELDYDLFMPGSSLRTSTVQSISDDILEATLTPEFFGPTAYQDGDTIPLPVSPIDGYTYSRAEIDYILTWADTTNGTGSNLRLPMFYGLIGQNNGVVRLQPYRLPPGGPYVLGSTAYASITVIVMARRQAALPTTPVTVTVTPGSGVTGSGAGSGADVPTMSGQGYDHFTGDSTTTGFTLTNAFPIIGAIVWWNGVLQKPSKYSISGTTLTTAFTDAGGNAQPADTNDDIDVVWFF